MKGYMFRDIFKEKPTILFIEEKKARNFIKKCVKREFGKYYDYHISRYPETLNIINGVTYDTYTLEIVEIS